MDAASNLWRLQMANGNSNAFNGPDELAEAVIAARHDAPEEQFYFGDVSEEGIRRLIAIAYYASQAANEQRYPSLKLLIPAKDETVNFLVHFEDELTISLLCRMSPVFSSQNHALVIEENNDVFRVSGVAAIQDKLTRLSLGDPTARPVSRARGFLVHIVGPGELRASEHRRHRLRAGSLHQEWLFAYDDWFRNWTLEVALRLFNWTLSSVSVNPKWPLVPPNAVAGMWCLLLEQAADLRHGGCFVILPEPFNAPIKHVFRSKECNLGLAFANYFNSLQRISQFHDERLTAEQASARLQLRERLLSTIDAIAGLTATDGCVVFNRLLELQSFGSMIEEANHEGSSSVPCFEATCFDTEPPRLLSEEKLRTFGARRRSAIQLCRVCPGAMAFVISQDGELRNFVRTDNEVRIYDNAAYW
jgi:hypothetical protein